MSAFCIIIPWAFSHWNVLESLYQIDSPVSGDCCYLPISGLSWFSRELDWSAGRSVSIMPLLGGTMYLVCTWYIVWQGSSPLGGRMAREYAAGRETPHVFSSHLQTPQGKFATGNPFAGGRRGGVLGWHWCIDAQVFVRTPVVFISLWFDLGRESGCGRKKRWCSLAETNISSPGSKYLKYLFVHKQFVCKQYFLTRVQRRELSGASQINNLDWR